MPAHHALEAYLDAYIEVAGIRDVCKSPLFRSATGSGAPPNLACRIRIGCHTFRATGITAYLEAGGTLETPRLRLRTKARVTTKLYDRTGDEITLDEVERKELRFELLHEMRTRTVNRSQTDRR
jgi:hypothetical protein